MTFALDAPLLVDVRLENFRCFTAGVLEPHPALTVLAGGNGAGKTSLLEAIYVLGRGTSFRAARAETAIRFGAEQATVFGRLAGGPVGRLGVELSRASGLAVRVDGATAGRAELVRALPVQALDPASHELISGAPAVRRQFVDWGVFHVEQAFLPTWQRYRRTLQQRNAALRLGADTAAWAWDDVLVTEGRLVDQYRRAVIDHLRPLVAATGAGLLAGDLEIGYLRGWADGLELADALREARPRDLAMGSTQVGPHRADLRISHRDRRARGTASRGQEKLLAAALTLAQIRLVSGCLGRPIVLVVDEPAADLDRAHLGALLDGIQQAPVQAFITALDARALPLPAAARVFHVEHGEVRALL